MLPTAAACWRRGGTSKCSPEDGIDVVVEGATRQPVRQLELDKPEQQGIERAADGEELLGNRGEGLLGGDHPRERPGLPARPLRMHDKQRALTCVGVGSHGATKAAPVMPAAACPGSVQMNVCVPGSLNIRVMVRD